MIPKTIVAIICVTILQIVNMLTAEYNNGIYLLVMLALLSLAGYEVRKHK